MSNPSDVQPYIVVAIAVLVAWRVYSRVRRLVGRQRFRPFRAWFQVCFFPILVILLFLGTLTHPLRSLSEIVGVAIGMALGLYGLRLTRFEDAGEGHFYTPSAHIGIALSLLVVGRLGYRLLHGYLSTAGFTSGFTPGATPGATPGFTAPSSEFVTSPLTLLIVGTLAGYYATYAFGLLRWRHTGKVPTALLRTPPSGS